VVADALQDWLTGVGVKPIQIYPGSPWENGYNERFNGALRRETPQRQVVLNCRAGQNRHRNLAETIQPHQAASGPRHAPASPGNSTRNWPITMGPDRAGAQHMKR